MKQTIFQIFLLQGN